MFIYNAGRVTANGVTSGSINTEVDHMFLKSAASQIVGLLSIFTAGKSAGITTISSIAFRLKRFATASTGGSNDLGANAVDPGYFASSASIFLDEAVAITPGATPTYIGGWIMGATGPGGWTRNSPGAPTMNRLTPDTNVQSVGTASLDMFSASAGTALPFEYTLYYDLV